MVELSNGKQEQSGEAGKLKVATCIVSRVRKDHRGSPYDSLPFPKQPCLQEVPNKPRSTEVKGWRSVSRG